MLKIKKLFLLFFFFFSFYLFPFFYHTTGQKSVNLNGETDSTAKFTLWTPWTATSQTPWIKSYTHSLATISIYHQSPLSFTYHTPYTTSSTLHNQHNNILHTPYTYNNIYNNPLHTITWSCRHTCRSHAVSCRSHAVSCRSHAGSCRSHAVTCTLYPYLVDFAEHHSLDTGSELFFLTLHPLFVDRLCIHMT